MTETRVSLAHDWKPGFRPSNGTMGSEFTARHCDRCEHDHSMHNGNDQGPGCLILCSSIAGEYAYPAEKGPPEWEIIRNAKGEYATRCTAFEACGPCTEIQEAEREKAWPTTTGDGWKPKAVAQVIGKTRMFDD